MKSQGVIDRIFPGSLPSASDLHALLTSLSENDSSAERLAVRAREVSSSVFGGKVFLRGLVEIGNVCRNDCYYCGIRWSNKQAQRYRLSKEQILDFRNLRFMEKTENILLIGTPGVGKTHLATSIGIEAAKNRNSTYFINCNDLILQLKRAHLENRLETRLKFFAKYKLLIIDEVGFLPLDSESSNLLFQLITKRYEKHSTIITTNKSLSRWGEVFGDNVLANAILDRLIHHSHIINITGRSYRTKDKISMIEDDDHNNQNW